MKISAIIEFLRKEKGIAVPVIAALVAAFLAMGHIERKERELLDFAEPFEVVTASADIQAGEMISISAIVLSRIPRKFIVPRPIFKIEDAAGRIAAVTIPAGSQISHTLLLPEGDIPLSAIIPAGMRLVTLALPEAYGQMNISRGDRVDVIATFNLKENGSAKGASLPLVEGAFVVAAGDRNSHSVSPHPKQKEVGIYGGISGINSERGMRSISIAVAPGDDSKIYFASHFGELSFSLRPMGDSENFESSPVTIESIAGRFHELNDKGVRFKEFRGR